MANEPTVVVPDHNRLLATLPSDEYGRLTSQMETVALELKQLLWEADGPIANVYFPLSGVVSLLAIMRDGTRVEVATVGNEGLVGLPVYLGAQTVPFRAFAQVPGTAWRMPSDTFRREVRKDGPLRAVLDRYTQAMFDQAARTAACNRAHTIGQRCARWLLMTQDRAGANEFLLTQEFLSDMLGVRRASVNAAAQELSVAGLIDYTRGKITILDRKGLEQVSCECYFVIRDEYDRLLGNKAESR